MPRKALAILHKAAFIILYLTIICAIMTVTAFMWVRFIKWAVAVPM